MTKWIGALKILNYHDPKIHLLQPKGLNKNLESQKSGIEC